MKYASKSSLIIFSIITLFSACKDKEETPVPPDTSTTISFVLDGTQKQWNKNDLTLAITTDGTGNDSVYVNQFNYYDASIGRTGFLLELTTPIKSSELLQLKSSLLHKKQSFSLINRPALALQSLFVHAPVPNGGHSGFLPSSSTDTTLQYYSFSRIDLLSSDNTRSNFIVEGNMKAQMDNGSGVVKSLTNGTFRLNVSVKKD